MPQHSMAQHRSTGSLNAGSEAVCPSTVCTAFMMAWPFMAESVCCRHLGTCNWQLPAQPARPTLQRRLAGRHAFKQVGAYLHTMCTAQMQVHTCCLRLGIVTGRAVIVQTGLLHGSLHMASATYTHTRLITSCLTVAVQLRPKVPNIDQHELYYQAGPDALKVQVATTPRCCRTASSIDGTYAPCGRCFYSCR